MTHPLDSQFARRSNLIRKGIAYGLQTPRTVRRLVSGERDFAVSPPVIVNSIPKSGTHLLMQLARALPGTRYYGSFLAQRPSITMVERSQDAINFHISRIVPGEIVGAHLHYSKETSEAFRRINALHLMIIRNPADILQSEAHYLGHMNRFHRMSREFRGLSPEDSLQRAFEGSLTRPDLYPPFEDRILPYLGWLEDANTVLMRYEDVSNERSLEATVDRIVNAYVALVPELTADKLRDALISSINPEGSHTRSKREKLELPAEHGDVAERLRQRMNYD